MKIETAKNHKPYALPPSERLEAYRQTNAIFGYDEFTPKLFISLQTIKPIRKDL
jgi:hypothetical protein